jgi:hypothetical protein
MASSLQASLIAARRKRRARRELIAPGLSLGAALKSAGQAADVRYGPQQRQIQSQARGSTQRQGQITNWFAGYQDEVRSAVERQKQAQAAANARIDSLQQGTAQADQQLSQQIAAQRERTAQTTRAPVQDPPHGAQASASRRNLRDVFGAANATQGQSQANYLSDVGRIGAGSEVAAHQAEANRRASIGEQYTALQGEKGQYKQSQIESLKAAAEKLGLAEQSLGLSGARVQTTIRGQNVTKRGQTLSHKDRVAKDRAAQEKDAYQRAHGLGPYKPAAAKGKSGKVPRHGLGSLTQGQENTYVDQINQAKEWVNRLRNSAHMKDHDVYSILRTGGTLTDKNGQKTTVPKFGDWVNPAFDLVVHGHLSGPNVKALHDKGLHVPAPWRPKKSKR